MRQGLGLHLIADVVEANVLREEREAVPGQVPCRLLHGDPERPESRSFVSARPCPACGAAV